MPQPLPEADAATDRARAAEPTVPDGRAVQPAPGGGARPGERRFELRTAGPPDAPAIAEVVVAGWQGAYRGMLPDPYLDGLSVESRTVAWRSLLEAADPVRSPTWLAVGPDGPLGFLSSGPPRDDDVGPEAAEIYAIYVIPPAWRSGTGRMLMQAAVERWRGAGRTALVLWVLERNARARAFYEALGWRADGGRQEIVIAGVSNVEIRYRLALG